MRDLQNHFEISDKKVRDDKELYEQDFADKFNLLLTGLDWHDVEFDYTIDYNVGVFKFHNIDNFMLQVLLGDEFDVYTYVNYNSIPKDKVVVKLSSYTTYSGIMRLYIGIVRCYQALAKDSEGKYLYNPKNISKTP